MQQQILEIKQLRQDIDATITGVKTLTPSRESALVVTKLQEGRMLIGQLLNGLGDPYPYPKDGSKTEPTDVSPAMAAALPTTPDAVAGVREQIQKYLDRVVEFSKTSDLPGGLEFTAHLTGAYISLRLAKNWTGVLIGELHKAQTIADTKSQPKTSKDGK